MATIGRWWIAGVGAILAASAASVPGSAEAQEVQWVRPAEPQEMRWERQLPAPDNNFELKVGAGYTQGFGMAVPGRGIPNVAGAGVGVPVDLDWRTSPRWSWGLQGEYQEFANELNTAARGLVGNLGVTYHSSPFTTSDVWLRLAAGYRLLWSVDPPGAPTTLIHGFEIAKLTVGWDIRMSSGVAIAPTVGADVNLFLWETAAGRTIAMRSAQAGSFLFAGIQARFDAGPKVVRAPVVANVR
jgi:hypothetical protein